MDGISWTDLDADEQRVIAMLRDGISAESCDPVALLSVNLSERTWVGCSCFLDGIEELVRGCLGKHR